MRIDAYFTVPEVDPGSVGDATVVVADVVRATTTIIEALANGAKAIFPTASTEEAVRLASSLGREDTLLCGEQKRVKVEGFDLGNSPLEFTADAVANKKIVMSTANGTRALAAGQDGSRILPCAFVNLGAVAREVRDVEHLVAVCAGEEDRFSLDDALCVGHLIRRIMEDGIEPEMNDAALAARALASRKPTRRLLRGTLAGAQLDALGMGADLALCAEVDRHDIVVELTEQGIIRSGV